MTEDEDKPLFGMPQMEEIDDGPSWGSIIALGIIGIVLCVVIIFLI